MNWVQGGALIPVLLQIVATTGFGILFGAIYMRNRNLWSLAFIHGVYDMMQLGTSAIFNITGPTIVHSDRGANVNIINVIPYIVQMFAYTLISIFLLRKKKMKEIIDSDKLESNLKY